MDEDEDEFGSYGGFVPVVEGARQNSELYDAYRSHHSLSSPPYISWPLRLTLFLYQQPCLPNLRVTGYYRP